MVRSIALIIGRRPAQVSCFGGRGQEFLPVRAPEDHRQRIDFHIKVAREFGDPDRQIDLNDPLPLPLYRALRIRI